MQVQRCMFIAPFRELVLDCGSRPPLRFYLFFRRSS
jgi:hypothetical protein